MENIVKYVVLSIAAIMCIHLIVKITKVVRNRCKHVYKKYGEAISTQTVKFSDHLDIAGFEIKTTYNVMVCRKCKDVKLMKKSHTENDI